MNNQSDLISIIIPVYNAESSIKKCISSIQNSTYTNWEVILVDDGSTDNTLEVCTQLKENDNRIQVVSKENSGAGLSREYGMKYVKGKYLGFVDADDSIEPEMYSKLYNRIIKDGLDVCFCGNYEVLPNGNKKENNIRFENEIYTKDSIRKSVIRNTVWFTYDGSNENPMFSIWRGLYSVDLIRKNNIHFLNEREIGSEDGIFNFQVLCNVEKLGFVHECLYNYGINEESLTHNSARWDSKRHIRSNNWYSCIKNYAKNKGIENYVVPYLNAEYLCKVRKAIDIVIYENAKKSIRAYKDEKEKYVYLKNIQILRTKGNGIRNKLDFILCFYFLRLYRYKTIRRK